VAPPEAASAAARSDVAPPEARPPGVAAPAARPDLAPPTPEPPDVAAPPPTPPAVVPPPVTLPEAAPAGVVNYTRVDATMACAGTTPVDALPHLKSGGFASIINVRRAEEEGAQVEESKARAAELGLRYVHIPFVTDAPDPNLVEEFLAAVTDPANQPAFIHCGSANRVGALWYVKRVVYDGWSEEAAMEEAIAIGLRTPSLKDFAVEYARLRRL
jgi:uncharacterized protein (TIGR01244 family)